MLTPPHTFKIPLNIQKAEADAFSVVNEALQRLAARRRERITVSGKLARSKIAWKLATHQQAMLYRVVALGSGCALCWNEKNFLCSLIGARSLVETIALLLDLEDQLPRHLSGDDLNNIDRLIMKRTFGSRDAEWVKSHPEDVAINVLTVIKKLDKKSDFEGMLAHYEGLCELCHPNSQGHHGSFAKLDTATGTATYLEHKLETKVSKLLAGVLLIPLAERAFDGLDAKVDQIADLQHRINPVGGVDHG